MSENEKNLNSFHREKKSQTSTIKGKSREWKVFQLSTLQEKSFGRSFHFLVRERVFFSFFLLLLQPRNEKAIESREKKRNLIYVRRPYKEHRTKHFMHHPHHRYKRRHFFLLPPAHQRPTKQSHSLVRTSSSNQFGYTIYESFAARIKLLLPVGRLPSSLYQPPFYIECRYKFSHFILPFGIVSLLEPIRAFSFFAKTQRRYWRCDWPTWAANAATTHYKQQTYLAALIVTSLMMTGRWLS